jgi:hypothetical protein
LDAIVYGDKREEYRDIKAYWINRLIEGDFGFTYDEDGLRFICEPKTFDVIRFKHGYAKDAPFIDFKCGGIRIGEGRPEWGAKPSTKYFILSLENF